MTTATTIVGMSPTTGRRAEGLAHLRDSVRNILTTPIGSLVMQRDYGSLVPDLIDHPNTPATQLRVYAATVLAIARWEPRIRVQRVRQQASGSALTLALDAVTVDGDRADLDVPLIGGTA